MNWPLNSKLPTSSRLAAEFLLALETDFQARGAEAIATLRKNEPWHYLELILSLVDLDAVDSNPSRVSDEEMDALIAGTKDALAKIDVWEKEMRAEQEISEQTS
ncbi:MAG TPA: hypothetical protein VEU06_11405 [Micropepsaceae bacterium]|nr:hypothetical protein [Micropepsaceae bacterium]